MIWRDIQIVSFKNHNMTSNGYIDKIPLKNQPYPHPPGYKPYPVVKPPLVVPSHHCVVYNSPKQPYLRIPRPPVKPREVECPNLIGYEFASNKEIVLNK